MFEEEAEEYYKDVTVGTFQESVEDFEDAVLTAYKDGAEFGYNKAKEDVKHDLMMKPLRRKAPNLKKKSKEKKQES